MKAPTVDAATASSVLDLRRLRKMDAAIYNLLVCFSCKKDDFQPLTGPCGHTRCEECCYQNPRCNCGQLGFPDMAIDYTIRCIIEKRNQEMEERNYRLYLQSHEFFSSGIFKTFLPRHLRQEDALQPNNRPRRSWIQQNAHVPQPVNYLPLPMNLGITAWYLQCRLCMDSFCEPVTTPCGHTYCKACLQRSMDYSQKCPICRYSLREFFYGDYTVSKTSNAIVSIFQAKARLPPKELVLLPGELPIIICMVTFPSMNCPLHIKEPYNRTLIRLCLQTEERVFGIVCANLSQGTYHGTLLSIKDAIQCGNGDYLVTAVGLSRFKVKTWTRRHGYFIALVDTIIDERTLLSPTSLIEYHDLVRANVKLWLETAAPPSVVEDIRTAYGDFPDLEPDWMILEDGPKWIWWTLFVLPISDAEKMFCHRSTNIQCRILAIERAVGTLLRSTERRPIHVEECPLQTFMKD